MKKYDSPDKHEMLKSKLSPSLSQPNHLTKEQSGYINGHVNHVFATANGNVSNIKSEARGKERNQKSEKKGIQNII